jgi:hypothetical protein
MGEHAWRWGAYAGIAFVVLQIVANLVFGIGSALPNVPDTPKFADYMASNVGRVAAFAWVSSLAFVGDRPLLQPRCPKQVRECGPPSEVAVEPALIEQIEIKGDQLAGVALKQLFAGLGGPGFEPGASRSRSVGPEVRLQRWI